MKKKLCSSYIKVTIEDALNEKLNGDRYLEDTGTDFNSDIIVCCDEEGKLFFMVEFKVSVNE